MKRWLSLIKKRVTPGLWTQPAKTRRPLTMMTQTSVTVQSQSFSVKKPRQVTPPVDIFYTAPLVPLRHPKPIRPAQLPLCDVDLIMERYAAWQTPSPEIPINATVRSRPDSQVLPLGDIDIPAQAFVDYAFINFEPTYRVTVSEILPYQLTLQKPRTERFSRRVVSFFQGEERGQVRFSAAIHDSQ